jgi:hypothetical protein
MHTMNFSKLTQLSIVVGLIFFSTSLFAQKVNTDYDKATDFTKYTSASFLGWQEGVSLNDFDKKRFIDAFKVEMEKRNITLVESGGDMAIALYIVAEQKTSTTAYTNYYGGGAGRGYRRGGRGGWGGGYSSTSYSESDYLQGTLVMDVFEGESKEQIWQAVATKTVNEKPEKREKSIPKGVKKVMKKFPIAPAK